MSSDPWFWSVDEVVTQLCHSFALFLAAAQSAADIPDCPALEAELRMRNITGEALLKFDASRLVTRNELRIAHSNQRSALYAVIEVLQRRSHVYKLFRPSTSATNSIEGTRNDTTAPLNGITEASPVVRKQVRIKNISREPLRQAAPTQRMPGGPDEFEHLLRWQDTAGDDEIIDFAADGSLGDDEYADWPDVTHAEDELDVPLDSDENENEDLPTQCGLSKKEIYAIIDERINFYMDSWRPNAGVIPGEEVDYDVNAMWDKAEASGQRQNLVQKYEAEYEYFKLRLDTMREEIRKSPGNNANQIRRQCRNLEGTVESMELAAWLRDIYKLEPVADSDDELANHSDSAVGDASTPKSHAVADIEVVDLDSSPEPAEVNRSTQHATYLFGIPIKQQTQTLTPKSRVARSIEHMVDNHHHESQHSTRIISNYGDEPERASISSVRRWKWHELIEHLDRKRIVSKAIFEMDASDREAIRTRVRLIKKTSLLKELTACVNMLKKGEHQLRGILPEDMRKIANFTNLFLSWWFCKNFFEESNASVGDFEELQSCIADESAGTTTFYDYLRTIMETTFSQQALQHPEQPSQAEIIEISDDD
ncbi:hypothetical protein yc1106_05817 [Curvularia clavata]|uniref:DUF7607 domain-containing protein n=1 Tax=Curvularia clavata TaxID=95742 RepID=A0A9Q8ZE25_CURCL|nr:hypothetical protein yc1106_05817 [Curvularia clavata]